ITSITTIKKITVQTFFSQKITTQFTIATANPEKITTQCTIATANPEKITTQCTIATANPQKITTQFAITTANSQKITTQCTIATRFRGDFTGLNSIKRNNSNQRGSRIQTFQKKMQDGFGREKQGDAGQQKRRYKEDKFVKITM
ncbi:MAG: hypothetical protein SFV22_10465, partial [Saprospiraceae bacterium]|nr:hypothetical protein [Saprospiraceae bacterium]